MNNWRSWLILPMMFLFLMMMMVVVNFIPSREVVENLGPDATTFIHLSEVKQYRSEFTVKDNGLNRIDVLFKNPNLESRDELVINILNENDQKIASQQFTGFNLGDTSYARVDFPKISDSQGKTYIIEIKPTKIIDGKLQFGVKDNKGYFIQYYSLGFSRRRAEQQTKIIWDELLHQPLVIILPILAGGIWLW